MDNERIETRTFFRFKNFRDRISIARISRKPVNGFGGERDDFSGA